MSIRSPLSPFVSALFVALASPLLGQSATAATAAQGPKASEPKKDNGPKPWRLNTALGSPSWLTVSGEQRSRLESLDNQFRRSANGAPLYADHDDVLALRTSLKVDAKGETLGGVVEILDARMYGFQADSYVDTTMVDTADALQAYGSVQLGELGDGKHELRAGREAIDLGNRRLMARNAFRNTINAFDGVDWIWSDKDTTIRSLVMLPVERLPSAPTANPTPQQTEPLRHNEWELDNQDPDSRFAAVYATEKWGESDGVDVYMFGLDENAENTRMRELLTPGFRLFGNCATNTVPTKRDGAFFYEVEAAAQFGQSKTNAAVATPVRDHRAWFAHASLGYAFDAPWKPALMLSYDFASGDESPTDDTNGRFDTLFGARRWEYGPTGIYGAIARANLESPELRVLLQPVADVNCMLAWRGVWLAEERDAWTASGLRDQTGASGSHVGDQIEGRVRWDVIPKSFDVEVGFAFLFEGSFQEKASGGRSDDVYYGYLQTTWRF
jgi:Alginate export